MARVLNTNATLACVHGGLLQVVASQSELSAGGAPALLLTDLLSAKVPACPAQPPVPKCLAVTGVTAGVSRLLAVAGTAVVLETAAGTTNAGTFQAQAPGQNTLKA